MMKVTAVLAILITIIVKGIDSQFSLPAIRIGGPGSTMAHRAIASSQSGGGGRGGRSFTDSFPRVRISSRGISFGIGRPNYKYSRNSPFASSSEISPSPPMRPPMSPPFPPMLPFPPMPFEGRPRFGPAPFRPLPPMMHPMTAASMAMRMGMPFYNQKGLSFPLTPYNDGMGFPPDDDFFETLGSLSKEYKRKRKLAARKPINTDIDAFDGEENDALPKPNESKKRKSARRTKTTDDGRKNESGFDDEKSDY